MDGFSILAGLTLLTLFGTFCIVPRSVRHDLPTRSRVRAGAPQRAFAGRSRAY